MSDTKILSLEEIEHFRKGHVINRTVDDICDSHATQARRIEELERQLDRSEMVKNLIDRASERDAALERAERAEGQLRQIKEALPGERALEIADRPLFCKPEERYSDRQTLRSYAKVLAGIAEPQEDELHGVSCDCLGCKPTEAPRPIEVGCTVRHKKQGWTARVESICPPGPPREATALLDNGQAWCFSQLEHLEPAADSGSNV